VKGGSDSELNAGKVVQHRKANPYTLENKVKTQSDDSRFWSALGIAHAGLGNKVEAINAV
jgi:Flp pilus assembly protein TadD